jgi:hypothetical protein
VSRPWFVRYLQATAVLMLAGGVFVAVWAFARPYELAARIVWVVVAVVLVVFGVRRLRLVSRASPGEGPQ